MLKLSRTKEIIQLLDTRGSVTVRELTELFDVTDVTIRRDLQELEEQGLLLRTHGGAVRPIPAPPALVNRHATVDEGAVSGTDALIIAPVQNRIAHTLRVRAQREKIPLFAESAPFDDAIYLGPNNYAGAFELGQWTSQYLQSIGLSNLKVLDLTAE